MTPWLIAIPAWGEPHVSKLINVALPSLRAALAHYSVPIRLLVHSDRAARVMQEATGLSVMVRTVPEHGDMYQRFGDCHREALAHADNGERVALLCADMAVSCEFFAACEARFAVGKRLIVAAATRTLADEPPPFGTTSSDLLAWTMRFPHPMVQACFWGRASRTPWAIYFCKGNNITLRGFHLHPCALVKDRPLSFSGTLDIDLIDNFQRDEVHVVTDPDELALAECSPADRPFREDRQPISVASIAEWARTRARASHWWLSTHRIVIAGNGDTDDEPIWNQVMSSPFNPLREAA